MGSATGKAKKSKLSYDEAVARLAEVRAKVVAAADEHARKSDEAGKQVQAIMAPVVALGQSLKGLRLHEATLQRIVDRGPEVEEPEKGKVENPHRAGELVAQQLEDGAEKLIEDGKFAGLVDVDVRLSTRIGGLARIKERDEFQTLAAARFRTFWDQAQIGGAKAIDYEQVRVDTSGSSADAVAEMGEEARRQYARAVQRLGPIKANLVQLLVCDNLSLRALARKLGRGVNFRDREAIRDEVLEAIDVLVKHYRMGPAAPRGGIRAEGEKAKDWGVGQSGAVEDSEKAA